MLTPQEILKRANAKAQGKRSSYLGTPAEEHLLSMVMVLAEELAVARERADTLERLLEERAVLTREDIESYKPDPATGQARQLGHMAFAARLFRSLRHEVETLQGNDKSAEDMAEELKRQ